MHIAVGRLSLKAGTGRLRFLWHTLRSQWQAKRAPGCSHAATRREEGNIFWSLSVWQTPEAMRAYRSSGAHLRAMQVTRQITGRADFVHWQSDSIPGWDEAMSRAKQELAKRS